MVENLELKKEMPNEGEGPEESESDSGNPRSQRLYIGVVLIKSGAKDVIERNRLEDFRQALNDPNIIEVLTIYRGFRKEFSLETKVVRTLTI